MHGKRFSFPVTDFVISSARTNQNDRPFLDLHLVRKCICLLYTSVITGSGGLTLAKHLGVPFVQEVIAVSTALQDYAPQTDVAIELGGEDAKIIYFEGGNIEQRMNGVCAGAVSYTHLVWISWNNPSGIFPILEIFLIPSIVPFVA